MEYLIICSTHLTMGVNVLMAVIGLLVVTVHTEVPLLMAVAGLMVVIDLMEVIGLMEVIDLMEVNNLMAVDITIRLGNSSSLLLSLNISSLIPVFTANLSYRVQGDT